MKPVQLSPEAIKALSAVRERAMDGYTLMKLTGLDRAQIETALRELSENSLIRSKGLMSGPTLGETYLWVPPDVKGYADLLLGRIRSSF